jgi:CheY-like chemotaxis protein
VKEEAVTAPIEAETKVGQEARTVLYIEDNLSNLTLIQRLVARRPELKLVPAMQGRLGLDLAREHHPDLVLLDLHLPDMNGGEVLRRLKADPETNSIPVIVISADAMPSEIRNLLGLGAREYLTKPLDVKKFFAAIDAVLGEPKPAGA